MARSEVVCLFVKKVESRALSINKFLKFADESVQLLAIWEVSELTLCLNRAFHPVQVLSLLLGRRIVLGCDDYL